MALPDDTASGDDGSPAMAVIEALRAENVLLRAEVAALTERLAELERRLGLNSRHRQLNQLQSDLGYEQGSTTRLCCRLGARLLVPNPEGRRTNCPIPRRGRQMASWTKVAIDEGVCRQEAQGLSC